MNMTRRFGPLLPYIGFYLACLLFFSIFRLVLVGVHWDRVAAWDVLGRVLILGVRMDTISLSIILSIPVIATLLLPKSFIQASWFQLAIRILLCFWVGIFVMMEFSTPTYIDFFDSRPGRIFFEYLNHPREVSTFLINGFLIEILIVSCAISLMVTLAWFGLASLQKRQATWPYFTQLIALPFVFLLLVLGARSSLGHRPFNASSVAFSNDQLLNELPLNSSYTVLNAVYALKDEGDPSELYDEMSDEEVIRRTIASSLIDPQKLVDPDVPTMHKFGPPAQSIRAAVSRKNLVIVLEESMGARFIGKLGGLPLSPEIDKLSDEGIWFENLYATGIRSARGIEAVVTGFPPSASRSVLKLGLAQQGFYTMAQTFKDQGYRNYFIYGGESHFDNMRGFLLNNGFDKAIDEKDFKEWKFKGSWGVSDEDVFDKAHEVFEQEEKPFFALVFSSSFHSPYDFPDDRIELFEPEKKTKFNGVKYADYAVGHFFRKAKQSSYWDNTIFLIVADHDERPRGSSLVPVSSYHIPGLILGSDVKPMVYDKVTSHIDLIPTLFNLMKVSGTAPYIGQDIMARPRDYPGRAIMQFGNNHAYMLGNQVVINRPDQPALQFEYRDKELIPTTLDEEFARDALAMALLPGLLYQNRWYQAHVKK
jgi:phosphoglycerol transferase MdoB-like AlkP superfamily enzyme